MVLQRRRRLRKPSLGDRIIAILPSRRPERGGTIREKGFWEELDAENLCTQIPPYLANDKLQREPTEEHGRETSTEAPRRNESPSRPTSSHSLASLRAKYEARRQRRRLKERGDYLGVQGFNPQTGVLDIITPSSSEQSARSKETDKRLVALKRKFNNRASSKSSRKKAEQEMRKLLLKKERKRALRREQAKAVMWKAQNRIRWQRRPMQWSCSKGGDSTHTIQPRNNDSRDIATTTGGTQPQLLYNGSHKAMRSVTREGLDKSTRGEVTIVRAEMEQSCLPRKVVEMADPGLHIPGTYPKGGEREGDNGKTCNGWWHSMKQVLSKMLMTKNEQG